MKHLLGNIFLYTGLIFLSLAISSCGGGGGGSGTPASTPTTPTTSSGKFIDAAVEGITYTSGSTTGTTAADGSFTYENGKSVTFSIGGITIGTVSGSAIITPVQLIAGATNQANPSVTNVVQFLLSIDDDNDATNGIKITSAMTAAAVSLSNIDFTSATFDTDSAVANAIATIKAVASVGSIGLVSNSVAQAHLSNSLFSIIAGSYSGTFSGNDSGTWSVTITTTTGATTGTVSGSGSSTSGAFTISGTINTSGKITASAKAGGIAGTSTWTGSLDITNGTFSGNWDDLTTIPSPDGSFSGSKN